MITLTPDKSNKRSWNLIIQKNDFPTIDLNLELIQSSLTNKFDIVANLYNDMNNIDGFSDWFYNFIYSYIESKYNSEIIQDQVPYIIDYAKKYIKYKNVDFKTFVNRTKTTKTSILFDEVDIEAIGLTSTCLKIYSIFSYDIVFKVPDNINKKIYNQFIRECVKNDTTDKIFELIRSRNFRSSQTDKFMWDLIKLRTLEDPETSVMSIFNFFMNNLLSLLNIESNPVHFLIKVVDDNLRWMMMEIYREKIIYEESFTNSDDINGSSVHKDIFHVYCCNDLILKAAKLGMKLLEEEYNFTDDQFLSFKERLDSIKILDPSMKLFTLPIISKVFDIPYAYLKPIAPKHIVLIGSLIFILGKDDLVKKYPILSHFLISCPIQNNTTIIKSSYKLRDISTIIEDSTPIFGINSKKLKYDIISPICGILSASKKNLVSVVDGKSINKITYTDLEEDSISFYINLYSNGLNDIFDNIQAKIDSYLI